MYDEVELFGHELIRPATPDQVAVLQRVGNKAHAEALDAHPDIAKAMADFDDIDKEVANRDYGLGVVDEETTDTDSNYEALLYGMCTTAESEAADLARVTHGIEEFVFNKHGRRPGQQGDTVGSWAAKKVVEGSTTLAEAMARRAAAKALAKAKAEDEAAAYKYVTLIERRDARDINSARITKIRNEMLKRGEKIEFDRIAVVRDDMISKGEL